MTLPDTNADALSDMRAANLHLQATIDDLRQSLEAAASDADRRVTRAQAEDAGRIADLTTTIQHMRDQMEAQQQAHERELQAERAGAQAAFAQLKGSIDAMRLTLEEAQVASDQIIMALETDHARERQALQQQIHVLRDKMEQMMKRTLA